MLWLGTGRRPLSNNCQEKYNYSPPANPGGLPHEVN